MNICITESLCRTYETNTTLKITFSNKILKRRMCFPRLRLKRVLKVVDFPWTARKYVTPHSVSQALAHVHAAAAAAAKSLQSCLTLCKPIDGSPPGSTVPGTLQARTLEWAAISFSSAWEWKVKVKLLSRVRLFATPWTAAYQALPSMGFSRQEYWSGAPSPSLAHVYDMFPKE